jgi:hypothetical protein
MSRQLFEAPTGAFDVDMRVRRLEERVSRLEAAPESTTSADDAGHRE